MIRRLKTEYFQWLFFNRCNRNKIIKDTRDDAWAGTLVKLQKGYIALMKKFTRKTKRFYYQSPFTQGASNLLSLQTEMLSNSSDALDSLCYVYTYRNVSISSNYWTTVVTSVFAFLLAPMTATGNAFVLAAIWGNPALRTPSHVFFFLNIKAWRPGSFISSMISIYNSNWLKYSNSIMSYLGNYRSQLTNDIFSYRRHEQRTGYNSPE